MDTRNLVKQPRQPVHRTERCKEGRNRKRGKGGCLSPFGLQKRYGRRKVLPGMAGYWPGKSWFL